MKHTQSSNCLQAPAVKAPPQSTSRLTPGLEVTYYPLSVLTAASKRNQPRWPAHWPGPCSNQANCLQWVSDPSLWNPPWPHPLATKHSWSPTTHDPLILVCCRHTWSCSLGLPACERLAVVQVNCAVMTTQPNRSLTAPYPFRQQEKQNHLQQECQSPSASNPLMT